MLQYPGRSGYTPSSLIESTGWQQRRFRPANGTASPAHGQRQEHRERSTREGGLVSSHNNTRLVACSLLVLCQITGARTLAGDRPSIRSSSTMNIVSTCGMAVMSNGASKSSTPARRADRSGPSITAIRPFPREVVSDFSMDAIHPHRVSSVCPIATCCTIRPAI